MARTTEQFPWFPMYAADWQISHSVRAMTREQRGFFIDLLTLMWDKGQEEPSLPADPADLRQLMSSPAAEWRRCAPTVLACFTERDGRLYNARLSSVWDIQRSKRDLLSGRGQRGAAARWHPDSNAQASDKQSLGNSNQTQSQRRAVPVQGRTPLAAPLAALVPSAIGALGRKP
jgi:uncharacterized protein YdaU (DUF1376 family)